MKTCRGGCWCGTLLAFSTRDGELLPLELQGCTKIDVALNSHTSGGWEVYMMGT